jgi:hypothetical protein
MNTKIILYSRRFVILIERVDASIQQLRFTSLLKLLSYILDNASIRSDYVATNVDIINKIPFRKLRELNQSELITALES